MLLDWLNTLTPVQGRRVFLLGVVLSWVVIIGVLVGIGYLI